MIRKILRLFKYGERSLVLPKEADGVLGCYVVAIIWKEDGRVLAIERTVNGAEERQIAGGWSEDKTFLKWMALMPDPASHTWGKL